MAGLTDISNGASSAGISTIKGNFIHPLLSYNFYIDGIPGVINVECKGTEIPGVKLDKIPVKFRGRELYYNGTIAVFDDWNVTIRESIYYRARSALEVWHNVMANNVMHFGLITPAITKTIDLYMLAPGTNVAIAHYQLINAFPHTIGAITLDQDNNTTVAEYTVNFAIDAWERKDLDIADLLGDASAAS